MGMAGSWSLGGFCAVDGRENGIASSAGNAERRDEDVHEHDEVEEVRRHVLPERNLAERQSLLSILVLLLKLHRKHGHFRIAKMHDVIM